MAYITTKIRPKNKGFQCPLCREKSKVYRSITEASVCVRYRQCLGCGYTFTTNEKINHLPDLVKS
jgi:transcriptional regulator NrdR family protein